MSDTSRSPWYVCVMPTRTRRLAIVPVAPTVIVFVTPVVLLSGIARFGEDVNVSTALPPPAACTTSVTVVECTSAPLVPVMPRVYVPAGVEPAVVTESVDESEPPEGGVTLAGE